MRNDSHDATILEAIALPMAGGSMLAWVIGEIAGVPPTMGVVAFAIAVHVLGAIYAGRFGGALRWTWVVMTLAVSISICVGSMGYIMAWGQTQGWAAMKLAELFGGSAEAIASVLDKVGYGVLAVPGLALFADWCMRSRAFFAAVPPERLRLAALVFALILLACLAPLAPIEWSQPEPPDFPPILPPWYILPSYAVLRAVPGKELGLAVALVMPFALVVVPWTVSERLRHNAARPYWQVASLAFVIAIAALYWDGMQPPDGGMAIIVFLAIGWYFAYLLVAPLVLSPRKAEDTFSTQF